ncbi:Carotenoid 9,10(9',10')-cleavage dioxygenase 1 [Glycine soja]|nr:Carotenoid 9,10(9',10')-cleavage dioxygenase 1 [Glycine soja]
MATSYKTFLVNCSIQKRPSYVLDNSGHYNLPLFLAFKPLKKVLLEVPLQIDEVHKTMANTAAILLDAFVDSFFEFLDQPLLPSQSNFAPVVELGEAIVVTSIQGQIPDDFPEGVYIINEIGMPMAPFTSHPKKAPGTGELVTLGVAATKPFAIIGIISAEGKKLVHKVDLNLNRCTLCHDIGVTQRYNVIMDFPLTIDLNRLLRRGPLIKYNKEEYARIGVMPRYGDANSIKWFEVEPNCTFHMINSFEDVIVYEQVVVRGCRSLDSLIPGPDPSLNEFEWLSRCHEWQLNMQTGEVKERGLCGANIVYMDFPMMNGNFIGIRNRYAYNNQVVDPIASSKQDVPKYGGLAKLYFEESCAKFSMPILRALPQIPLQIDASKTFTDIKSKFLNAVVDSAFEFVDQLVLPSQSNFAPVEELGEAVAITNIEGDIPDHFPEGVFIRNGPNPLFGGLKSSKSILGRTNSVWVEGEGMLHALYFKRESDGCYTIVYNNRYVETETYKLEKQSAKPLFLPAVKGDSLAVLSSMLLNGLRFGQLNKDYSNTNVFEHSGKFYSVSENHMPQEIDIYTLSTLKYWDVNGAWNRPFASHPKKVPGTGELVIFGVDATKPYLEIGIVSADGKELVHKEDIKLDRCSLCHDIGITSRYIAILDLPLIVDSNRLLKRGPLIKYEKEKYARIGIMPLYGDEKSTQWFEVEPNSTFHIINSFEDGHEVVLWGCRALDSIIPGPEDGLNESTMFSRCYEWRLNIKSGEVKEKYITGPEQFMDFPVINASFTGIKNRYGYTQVVDPAASYAADIPKYGALVKLYFREPCSEFPKGDTQQKPIRVEYHRFERNVFCTGSAFVPKEGGIEEDDGWIITFVHNEDTGISQVHIIDSKKFSGEAVAKITMPFRVPYGFHGAFMPLSL